LQKQTTANKIDSDKKREVLSARIHELSNFMHPVPIKLEDLSERLAKMSVVVEQLTNLAHNHTSLLSEHNKILDAHQEKLDKMELDLLTQRDESTKRKWFNRGALFSLGILGGVSGDKIISGIAKVLGVGSTAGPHP